MSMSDVIWYIPHLQASLSLLLFSILTSPFLLKKLLIVHIKQKQTKSVQSHFSRRIYIL